VSFREALQLESLWPGEMTAVRLGRTKVLLLNLDGEVVAYEDRCAHQGVELSLGRLEGRVLTCSAHQWQYDMTCGEALNPRGARLRRLAVKVEAGRILVDVDAGA
jgi:toluene monooxygenase system ferredoxin subunit